MSISAPETPADDGLNPIASRILVDGMETKSNPRLKTTTPEGDEDEEESETSRLASDDERWELMARGEAAVTQARLVHRYAPECVRHEFQHRADAHEAALAILTATDPSAESHLRQRTLRDSSAEPANTAEHQLVRIRRELRCGSR